MANLQTPGIHGSTSAVLPQLPVSTTTPTGDSDETSKLKQMKPHVPGIVIFADHNKKLPWSVTYYAVTLFADVSGFTALCEKYSTMGQSGVDQLTRTLNSYISALVEGILGSDGDILKFAGDAILAIWRVGRMEELQSEIVKVLQCCMDMQEKCGEWETDIGVKLTVKIGVAAGEMSVTFLGNREYRHYVELGPAIKAVNIAESFCQSGMVVVSPCTWDHCSQELFELEAMEDHKHMRVLGVRLKERARSFSLPAHILRRQLSERRKSSDYDSTDVTEELKSKSTTEKEQTIWNSQMSTLQTTLTFPNSDVERPSIEITSEDGNNQKKITISPQKIEPPKKKIVVVQMKKKGPLSGKLRKLVETVTEMKLDIALRLYILSPVLKKIDDNQPLEYLSEMRQVSIVFINLVLNEGIKVELLLQDIFEVVYARTKSMHGALNKVFLFDKGCTFLVIFGLPGYKHENDCVHALTCSGMLKSKLDNMEGVVHVSIGVTTGTTFCGVVGHTKRHEYSVIGRKVNMAARLMMHYPDMITCDEDTYQLCRLPPTFFDILATKMMKGLKNVGVIRQFIGYSKDEKLLAKNIIHTDYPVLGRQMEDFMFREQLKVVRREENKRQHLVFSGPSGIGKTKVLDQALCIAAQEKFKTISCRVEMEDSGYPYFVANHMLRSLLGNAGYTDQLDREPYILDTVGTDLEFLYVLNDVLGTKIEKPVSLLGQDINEKQKKRSLFRKIASMCLDPGGTIVIIDDAQYIDTFSWIFLCELLPLKHCLIVLSIRPAILDSPPCREALYFLEHSEVKVIDLGPLDLKFVAPLACQMMDVFSIPRELDRLLRERTEGVPSWCMENLRHMLKEKQLKIVIDDDRPDFQQDAIVPNPSLISRSTNTLENKLNVPSDNRIHQLSNLSVPVSNDDRDIISELGYRPRSRGHLGVSLSELRKGGYSKTAHLSVGQGNRIAILAPGVDPEDIPIPDSMKELIVARIDSMRSTDQLLIKCASVLGKVVRRDILEILLPKAHRSKLAGNINRLMESGIFKCSKATGELIKAATNENQVVHKYYCFCFKSDTESSTEETEACFEPMFTQQLLQETAYEVLMESQRNELHTKAARYLELCADELRNQIPFYILFRPPADDLEEQTKRVDVKLDDVEAVIAVRTKRLQNKVADEAFRLEATEARCKRGRRRAVFVLAEEATPLVEKIAEGATPLEATSLYIRNLVPIYESLVHHWMCTNQIRSALLTLTEAVAACLAIEMTDKAYEFVKAAMELLASVEKETPRLEKKQKVIAARIHRLHGEILYKAGEIGNTNAVLAKAAEYIELEKPSRERRSCLRILRLHIRFLICLKFHKQKKDPLDNFTLEQVYLLDDLFRMDKEQGNEGFKLSHALKQFMIVTSGIAHVHQVIAAYSAAIECSRERGWRGSCDMLQSELLHICASRKDELSSYDRGLLCKIYATSSTDYFLQGKICKANIAGIAAAEICVKIHNIKTTKYFAVFYFFLCLYRNELQKSFELLDVMKGAAHMSDDIHITVLYHVICIEIALAGGTPPERVHTSITAVRNYLSSTGSIHYSTGNYAAMTVALWYARREMWAKSEQLLKETELLIAEEANLTSLMAKANCIECILLTEAAKGTQYLMDKHRQNDMNRRIKKALEKAEHVPVTLPRFLHLQAYFDVLCNKKNNAVKLCKQAIKLCAKYGNAHEERWINHNRTKWFGAVVSNQDDADINGEWKEHAQDCGIRLNPLAKDHELILYTLPRYHVNKE